MKQCLWAQIDSSTPLQAWWKNLCKEYSWPENLSVEKWQGQDLNWANLIDSLHTYHLFGQQKVLIITEADRALKKQKDLQKTIESLQKAPHRVILASEKMPPKEISLPLWKDLKIQEEESVYQDKAAFRWIDAVHNENLHLAMTELETAIEKVDHPLVLLQLLTRHYRLGRLIQHAQEKRLADQETCDRLKIHAVMLKKWKKKQRLSRKKWAAVFERLHQTDWELKSGMDAHWGIRKLTFDLIQLAQAPVAIKQKKPQTPSLFSSKLWKVATSFA